MSGRQPQRGYCVLPVVPYEKTPDVLDPGGDEGNFDHLVE